MGGKGLPIGGDDFRRIREAISGRTRRPCVNVAHERAEALPLCASKFGGVPYWPASLPYPTGGDGGKLVLLAQFDMAEVPHLDGFPSSGLLQFFVAADDSWGLDFDDPTSRKGSRVVWHPGADPSVSEADVLALGVPTTRDESVAENFPFSGEFALSFDSAEMDVGVNCAEFLGFAREAAAELGFEVPGGAGLYDVFDEDALDEAEVCEGSRLGGYPEFAQFDPRSAESGTAGHSVLLFQMDSGDEIMWGDMGVANFFITPGDLAARDFSRVLYNWDCY